MWRDEESECLDMQTFVHMDTDSLYISNITCSPDVLFI